MAGSEFGSSVEASELVEIAGLAGRRAKQRTTTYGEIDSDKSHKDSQMGQKTR